MWTRIGDTAQSWATIGASAQTWTTPEAVSAESRLNRVFPQPEDVTHTPGEIDFMWQVRSEFPWFVAIGNNVQVKSSITEGF